MATFTVTDVTIISYNSYSCKYTFLIRVFPCVFRSFFYCDTDVLVNNIAKEWESITFPWVKMSWFNSYGGVLSGGVIAYSVFRVCILGKSNFLEFFKSANDKYHQIFGIEVWLLSCYLAGKTV